MSENRRQAAPQKLESPYYEGVYLQTWETLLAAFKHPHLAWRYLTGRSPSEFDLGELSRFLDSEPRLIVEAGTSKGVDTRRFLDTWTGSRVIGCEPVQELRHLAIEATRHFGDRVVIADAALVPRTQVGVARMFTNGNQHDSSSLLRPTGHLEVFPEIEFPQERLVPAITLDTLTDTYAPGQPVDLLWLDLQGFELQVLEGGGNETLLRTRWIHIEVCRRQLYAEASTETGLLGFLRDCGFSVVASRIPITCGNVLLQRL